MTQQEFRDRQYELSVTHGVDTLSIHKERNGEYCRVVMQIDKFHSGELLLCSQAHAEALYFMLGQLLGK